MDSNTDKSYLLSLNIIKTCHGEQGLDRYYSTWTSAAAFKNFQIDSE